MGGSFVTDVRLNVKMASNLGSAVAIGAQANGNTIGTNSTALSEFNKGLVDRIITRKHDKSGTSTINLSTGIGRSLSGIWREKSRKLSELLQNMYYNTVSRLWATGDYNSDDVNTMKPINDEITSYYLGLEAQLKTNTTPFFWPFNLSITFDGLSGIKMFQRFSAADEILPMTYRTRFSNGRSASKINFLATGVTHNVTANKWTSTLESLSVPTVDGLNSRPTLQKYRYDGTNYVPLNTNERVRFTSDTAFTYRSAYTGLY